jgi:UDP-N-acetylglucosamine/UDP-N-acetylgalactosamine diphosphorylase
MDIGLSLSHLKCALQSSDAIEVAKDFQPVSSVIDMISMTSGRKELTGNVGREAIKQSKVAAVIMSGGQGTRLGFKGPKGMYNLNMPSQKTIFQIHIEKILRMKKLFSSSDPNATDGIAFSPSIPIYIMTSNLNHHIIIAFFKDNSYFGYPPQDIVFFEQGVEPSFTHDGKIIIESESTLSLSPDGNGGIYRALLVAGCIDDMILRGVEHLHIYGIDNVLTKAVDPYFIGACIHNQAEVGNKVVWRASKGEKVGVTAQLDGRMHILEYSEIPQQLAESSDSNGKLLFGAANICNHYVSVRFLSEVILPNLSSTYHIAKKKIPYMDVDTRHTVDPSSINGLKIEMFIFDVFPLASRWTVVEVAREDEFAPVKNAPGSEQVHFSVVI